LGGGRRVVVVGNEGLVGSALYDAVHAVGRQGCKVDVCCYPRGVTADLGSQDGQGLIVEVMKRCSLVSGRRRLDVLVDRAAESACGRRADQAAQAEAGDICTVRGSLSSGCSGT
jgi:hypothetical protein